MFCHNIWCAIKIAHQSNSSCSSDIITTDSLHRCMANPKQEFCNISVISYLVSGVGVSTETRGFLRYAGIPLLPVSARLLHRLSRWQ